MSVGAAAGGGEFTAIINGVQIFTRTGFEAINFFTNLSEKLEHQKDVNAWRKGGEQKWIKLQQLMERVREGRDGFCTIRLPEEHVKAFQRHALGTTLLYALGKNSLVDDGTICIGYPESQQGLVNSILRDLEIENVKISTCGTTEYMEATEEELKKAKAWTATPENNIDLEGHDDYEPVATGPEDFTCPSADEWEQGFLDDTYKNPEPKGTSAWLKDSPEAHAKKLKDLKENGIERPIETYVDWETFANTKSDDLSFYGISAALRADPLNICWCSKKEISTIKKHIRNPLYKKDYNKDYIENRAKLAVIKNTEAFKLLPNIGLSSLQNNLKLAEMACLGCTYNAKSRAGNGVNSKQTSLANPRMYQYTKLSKKDANTLARKLLLAHPALIVTVMKKNPQVEHIDFAKQLVQNMRDDWAKKEKLPSTTDDDRTKHQNVMKDIAFALEYADNIAEKARDTGCNAYGEPLDRETRAKLRKAYKKDENEYTNDFDGMERASDAMEREIKRAVETAVPDREDEEEFARETAEKLRKEFEAEGR